MCIIHMDHTWIINVAFFGVQLYRSFQRSQQNLQCLVCGFWAGHPWSAGKLHSLLLLLVGFCFLLWSWCPLVLVVRQCIKRFRMEGWMDLKKRAGRWWFNPHSPVAPFAAWFSRATPTGARGQIGRRKAGRTRSFCAHCYRCCQGRSAGRTKEN